MVLYMHSTTPLTYLNYFNIVVNGTETSRAKLTTNYHVRILFILKLYN